MQRALAVLVLSVSLAACGSVPQKTFEIRAVDFGGAPVPCLVVVDHEYPTTDEAPKYTPCEVTVRFDKPTMNVMVHPAVRQDSEIVLPTPHSQGPYHIESRDLRETDPTLHLFILRINPDFGG